MHSKEPTQAEVGRNTAKISIELFEDGRDLIWIQKCILEDDTVEDSRRIEHLISVENRLLVRIACESC